MLASARGTTPRPRSPEIPSFAPGGAELMHRWGAPVFVVVGSGVAADMEFRSGDLVILDPQAQTGDLVVLAPARFGRPMLGRLGSRGPVTEPSGVACSPDRWRVAGRVALRMRPEPRDMPAVLRFPEPAATAPAGVEAFLAMELSVDPGPEVEALLRRRLPGFRVQDRVVQAQGGGALLHAPMEAAEALAAELWQRFHVASRVVVAPRAERALPLLRMLPRGGIAVLRIDRPVGPKSKEATEDMPAEAPPRRQLGFWGA